MIAQVLTGLLADVIFGWASSTTRSFQTEFAAFLEDRGLDERPPTKTKPVR